jgi:uncharacterized protein YodC (DUF2158 family)
MKLETKWNLGDKVQIDELKQSARITAILMAHDGLTYKCRWVSATTNCQDYFYEDELSEPQEKQAGFKP